MYAYEHKRHFKRRTETLFEYEYPADAENQSKKSMFTPTLNVLPFVKVYDIDSEQDSVPQWTVGEAFSAGP